MLIISKQYLQLQASLLTAINYNAVALKEAIGLGPAIKADGIAIPIQYAK